jgi:transposase
MPKPFKKDPQEYNQRKLLAQNVFDLLPEDDDCFVYEDIFSQIDTSTLEKKYSMAGQHAYHPRLITAILIYAYSQGIFSSRKIEARCKRDLSFMYISHLNCPNFRVLSDFRKDNWQFFKNCFVQSVAIAKSLGMVSLGHVSLDGSKFYANTSKYKAASYKRLNNNYKKLEHEIEDLLKKADNTDRDEDSIYHNGTGYSIPEDIKIKKKRLARIKRVKKALEERENAKSKKDIKDSSQISYADTEAKLMRTRGNFEYCYNGQISVDSKEQIIISEHLSVNENDKNELNPALGQIKDNTGSLPSVMTLDKGYATPDNINILNASGIDGYLAVGRGEKEKAMDGSSRIGSCHFSYNRQKDIFICPAGHVLGFKLKNKKRIYKSDGNVCAGCIYLKCIARKKRAATIYLDDKAIVLHCMAAKMKSKSSKRIYAKRKVIVEPVFGQIKTGGFRRFSLRGHDKAGGEFSIVCAVSNIKKIVKKIKDSKNTLIKEEIAAVMV